MKTFREQMQKVLKERGTATSPDDLKTATTPAAETIITYIRQWDFGSGNIALGRLLETDRWTKDGTMILERDFKGRPYPLKLPLAMAYERYRYGDQWEQFWPGFGFASAIKRIPANITKDWAKELHDLFFDMGRVPMSAVRAISLGRNVKQYGINNPYAFATWQREVDEWKEAQAAVDAFVVSKGKGWEHLTAKSLQDPERGKAFSKEISDILARADELVEPSFKAIKEADRKMYIRQDATRARNDVKTLGGFFKKYGHAEPNALTLVGNMINDVESQSLNV